MASGLHSTVASLQTRLFYRWVPKWYAAFSDPQGGFYERLGKGFKPVLTGHRRLVTQCRQLSIYSDFVARGNKGISTHDLRPQFDYITARYKNPATGLWFFSLDDNRAVADDACDFYAMAFVVFACSHYYRATFDERARDVAKDVLNTIHTKFRLKNLPGFAEAVSQNGMPINRIRRQNPHMHMLEACLFAFDVWDDADFMVMADELVGLFYTHFYKPDENALIEFLTDDLQHPDPQKGANLEPGHYFEWVWLLKKHARIKGQESIHDKACGHLLDFANRFGWDSLYGGIFDTISKTGTIIQDTKRIWPFCEGLKANALMLEQVSDRQGLKDRVTDMVNVFNQKYMQERGFWTEWLNRNLTPAADYMPGTTPYHVYFGITETMDVLDDRGQAKSWTLKIQTMLYKARRWLSGVIRFLRLNVIGRG